MRSCPWCGRSFRPRVTGSRAQRYCSPACRRTFEAALDAWAREAVRSGAVDVGTLRRVARAQHAACPGRGRGMPEISVSNLAPAALRNARVVSGAERAPVLSGRRLVTFPTTLGQGTRHGRMTDPHEGLSFCSAEEKSASHRRARWW